jgi:hypothetical protein
MRHRSSSCRDAPDTFESGAEWVVEMSAFGERCPSWADWDWHVRPYREGAEVVVTRQLHPRTFWRRVLLARIRDRRLAKREVPASLAALGRYCSLAAPRPGAPKARTSP